MDPGVLPKDAQAFAKSDYVLVGMLIAGGARTWVDVEDVAVLCYRLNPPAFRWSRYDYPHLETVARTFRALKEQYGDRVIVAPAPQSTQRRLTAAGLKRARALGERLIGRTYKDPAALVRALRRKMGDATAQPAAAAGPAAGSPDARVARATLSFLANHAVYRAWTRKRLDDVPLWQIADLLQCLPDSPAAVWRERLTRHQSLAAWWSRPNVQAFLEALSTRLDKLLETHGDQN